MAGDADVASDACLQVPLGHLECSRFGILFYPVEELFEPMDKNNIHPLAIEQFCEENLDSFAEVMHRGLLHNLVHGFEDIVFVDNFFLYPVLQLGEVQQMIEKLLEYLITHNCSLRVEILDQLLIVVGNTELVHQN